MQTNSDSEPTSADAFSGEEDKLDLEPKPEAIIEDPGTDDPVEAEPMVHPSELAPPKVRAPSKHLVKDEKYGDLDGVGMIYGNVGFHGAPFPGRRRHREDGVYPSQAPARRLGAGPGRRCAEEDRSDHREGQEDIGRNERRHRRDGGRHGQHRRFPRRPRTTPGAALSVQGRRHGVPRPGRA